MTDKHPPLSPTPAHEETTEDVIDNNHKVLNKDALASTPFYTKPTQTLEAEPASISFEHQLIYQNQELIRKNLALEEQLEQLRIEVSLSVSGNKEKIKSHAPHPEHTITQPVDNEVPTEMCYSYRIGALFVDPVKFRHKILLTPIKAALLAFDFVTGLGRKKQATYIKNLRDTSPTALSYHSQFIELTAAYQLGKLLKHTLRNPKSFATLAADTKEIYERTKPDL